jgi:nucleoid-associated protein YgaU
MDTGISRSADGRFGLSSAPAAGYSPLAPAGDTSPLRAASAGEQASFRTRGAALSEERRHRVVDGDTLTALAERYLGSSERFGEIYELNRNMLTSADLLPIGAELRIPASLPASASGDSTSQLPMVPVGPRPGSAGSEATAARTYRVKRNDTLTGIARQVYGDARRYRELLEANRGTISRPEDLREGTLLVVP